MEKFKLYFLNNKKIFIIAGCILAIAICSIGCYFYYQYMHQDEVIIDDNLFDNLESDIVNNDSEVDDNDEISNESETIDNDASSGENNKELQDEAKSDEQKEQDEELIEYIYVDIKGYVNKPGVYKVLKNGNKRIYDLITLAGGLKKNADTSVINLSTKLKDEMVVIIYSKDEIEDFIKTKEALKEKTEICDQEEVKNDSCITDDDIDNNFESNDDTSSEDNDSNNNDNSNNGSNNNTNSGSNDNNTNNNGNSNDKVNINTASLELLMTLSGIGESKAQAIINYRNEVGLFETIDDIKNVSGIGDNAFEKIKDFITVE